MVAIAKDDALLLLELLQRAIVADIISLCMSNWNAKHGSSLKLIRKGAVHSFNSYKDMFANEVQIAIADQGAGQKTRFAENLKTVTYSQYKPSTLGKLLNCFH